MNIVFVSNFINHHQLPLSYELLKVSDNYTFIATSPIDTERIKLGYNDENKKHKFILTTYDDNSNIEIARRLITDSDIAIFGTANDSLMIPRFKKRLLTFHYSERYYKKGLNVKTFLRYFISSLLHIKRFQNKMYYLCASAYAAGDINTFANYTNRMFKWGYFPETKYYSDDTIYKMKIRNQITILWVGRLINWKHPEVVIEVARKLNKDNFNVSINIIGTGEMEEMLRNQIKELELTNRVHILGSMPPDEVRKYMEKSNIFLFTSDYNEGWGAVLNEAMNSACAVVASHAIGAVPFLIKNNYNGIIYENGNIADLYSALVKLISHPDLAFKIGINAYKTIINEWNAEVASKRLITLSENIISGKESPFKTGPCSPAAPVKEKEMYNLIK